VSHTSLTERADKEFGKSDTRHFDSGLEGGFIAELRLLTGSNYLATVKRWVP